MFMRTLTALFVPGDIIEARVFDKQGNKIIGRYPFPPSGGPRRLAETLADFDADEDNVGCDIYLCLNPTKLEPRPLVGTGKGSEEADIAVRRWFLLDGDSVSPHDIATEEQFQTTLAVMREVQGHLIKLGFSRVLLGSSGNGVHALVYIDAPNDFASKEAIRAVQLLVSEKFSNSAVSIQCFPDADRLVRCYGSLNRKGVETETLKYRRSALLD